MPQKYAIIYWNNGELYPLTSQNGRLLTFADLKLADAEANAHEAITEKEGSARVISIECVEE